MKKNLVVLSLAAVLAVMVSFAAAGDRIAMRVHIPFDFYMENQMMQAGDYRFEMGSGFDAIASRVTVQDKEGRGIRMILTHAGSQTDASLSALRFNRYGNGYFLSNVSICGYNANLTMLKLEKELRAEFKTAQAVLLLAQND